MKSHLLAAALLLATLSSASPPVNVTLRSAWPAAPFLTEILETIALEDPDAFFPMLDALTDPAVIPALHTITPQAVHEYVLQLASTREFLTLPGSIARVEMNLALHAATPKIEAFYDHYDTRDEPNCGSWVDWYGTAVCNVQDLMHLAGVDTIDEKADANNNITYARPTVLAFDHIYPSPSTSGTRPPRTAILYSNLTSSNFYDLHSYLLSLADEPNPRIEYVFRHAPTPRNSNERAYLTGYGVALDIKKMDYLAVDDRYSHSQQAVLGREEPGSDKEAIIDPILELLDSPPTDVDLTVQLTEDEIRAIGLQATQLIRASKSPLAILTTLSQNFPKYSTLVARRVSLDKELELEVAANSARAQQGASAMWINGASVAQKDVSPLGLLRVLQKERTISLSLQSLGLNASQVIELITHPSVAAAQSTASSSVTNGIFDATDRQEGGDLIVWWNDIEKDMRYDKWSPSILQILRPLYPGQYHNVKLNMFNVILAFDLSERSSISFLSGIMSNIISRNFPFRFGVVPLVETELSTKMAKLLNFLVKNHGRKKTLEFLKQIDTKSTPIDGIVVQTVDWSLVRTSFDEVFKTDNPEMDIDLICEGSAEDEVVDKAKAYAKRLGITTTSSKLGHVFVNGKYLKYDENFLRVLPTEVALQLQHLQEKLYTGALTDTDPTIFATYFYDLPTTHARRNRHIFPDNEAAGSLRIINLPDLYAKAGLDPFSASFIYPESDEVLLSTLVIADLDTPAGTQLVKEALKSMSSSSKARITFIHNPSDDNTSKGGLSHLLSHLISSKILPKAHPSRIIQTLDRTTDFSGGSQSEDFDAASYDSYVLNGRRLAGALGLGPGEKAIVINGRLVGPLDVSEFSSEFSSEDFSTIEEFELKRATEAVFAALKNVTSSSSEDMDRASLVNLVSMSASVISAIQQPDPSEAGLFDAPPKPRTTNYRMLDGEHTMFTVGDNTTALYHVAVLVDPLSETAQKWSSYLEWLTAIPGVFLEVHLHPSFYEEVPLKRFYRYNLQPSILFDDAGNVKDAETIFEGLPIDPIYTLAMDVSPSWLVRPREAVYDLDNIQLGKLSPEDQASGVTAIFDLDYIVIEGHAREARTQTPPRGLQLQLIDNDGVSVDDTQVVANLGYFQFKAKPGVFKLEIREGRGRSIYAMESVGNDGWNSPTVEAAGDVITVTSFEGVTLYPRLARKPGMELEDVLDEGDDDEEREGVLTNIASKFKSFFGSKTSSTNIVARDDGQAEINIFTVASGLLYERFVSIMILSVLRNTQSTVKFWFIENFLSPSFLEFIPYLAKEYNFQYELVTYKWPSWLRAQKEKQRIIWAYKILFLDVLFPMDLKKVIFVDADQIVRADLKELIDLDLHGAPYGYTPMGDDNADMEGFRFWKTGYWKNFLRGRPYHISALYVVDLVRFRQTAAGDLLRGQYQQLSADPNSLANLDQDLPNNLQHQVPIFSLPEDWLWCETWCSKDRLHRAKTIDLCQNPLTKEPKLSRARQIPEWEEYDSEISRFARGLAEKGLIRSRIATADANVLAGSSAISTPAESTEDPEREAAVDTQSTEEVKRDEL